MPAPDLKPCPFCSGTLVWSDTYREYHHPVGKCILSGHKFKKGVIGQWNTSATDPAAIREAALREAAAICIGVSNDVWTQIGREHAPYMKATAEDCSKMILALIGENK